MSKLSKLLIAAGAVAGVVLLALVLSRRPGNEPERATPESISESTAITNAATNSSSFFIKRDRRNRSANPAGGMPMEASAAGTNLIAAWEDKVDEILGSASPDPDKAKQMLEMFPQVPADGQEELARHISNLLPDQDYGLIHTYLTNAVLPEEVLDVLLGDALNRPNGLKLPALLAVARTPQHPKAGEAKDFLELFLEEDYGNDWGRWQSSMEQWLKDNPD
jgi:hypothetical protein